MLLNIDFVSKIKHTIEVYFVIFSWGIWNSPKAFEPYIGTNSANLLSFHFFYQIPQEHKGF